MCNAFHNHYNQAKITNAKYMFMFLKDRRVNTTVFRNEEKARQMDARGI